MIIILYIITLDICYILIFTSLYNVFVKNWLFSKCITISLVKRHEQIGSGAISNKIHYCYY